MNQFSYKSFYRRRLPHIQPEGATFFVTFRLAGSLPVEVLEKLRDEQEQTGRLLAQIVDANECAKQANLASRSWFGKWDEFLDKASTGPRHLANPQIADMLSESIRYRDGKVYELESFCIMPNHGHLVFKPLESVGGKFHSLSTIMHSLKRHTARQANLLLGREGTFWQHENYDHFVRDDAELGRIIRYVLHNPVKAGLADDWKNWKWSFCKYAM
ncbi:MAG: transposase [Anaerolineales bacterium]